MYKVKSRIWIEGDNGVFLGEGRIKLLKSILDLGSLSKAAKHLGMSYKKAWNLIDSINKNAHQPIIESITGGSGGGGMKLTPYGLEMIEKFDNLHQNCWVFLEKEGVKLEIK